MFIRVLNKRLFNESTGSAKKSDHSTSERLNVEIGYHDKETYNVH